MKLMMIAHLAMRFHPRLAVAPVALRRLTQTRLLRTRSESDAFGPIDVPSDAANRAADRAANRAASASGRRRCGSWLTRSTEAFQR